MQSIVVNSCTSIRLSNFKTTTASSSVASTATATTTTTSSTNRHRKSVDGRSNLARVILKSLLSDYGGGGGQTLKFCNTNTINDYEVNKIIYFCLNLCSHEYCCLEG